VALECCESSYDLTLEPVRGHPIRDALLRFGNKAVNGVPEVLQGGPLGLVKFRQVLVNLLLRHEINSGQRKQWGQITGSLIWRGDDARRLYAQ
jgi:hypothetical protein